MKKIFVNKNSQVRSGWKILLTFIAFLIFNTILNFITGFVYVFSKILPQGIDITNNNELVKIMAEDTTLNFILSLLQSISVILVVIIIWKAFEKKPLKSIGLNNLKHGYKDLIKGVVFGAISIGVVFVILLLFGDIKLENGLLEPNITTSLLTGLILFTFVGFNEELFARGYCMSVLKQTNNKWVMIIVSSIIFSLLHGLNPNVSAIGLINIFLVGALFAYMFIKSENIWMPIGYHFAWNYFQGNIFGFNVSGLGMKGLYKTKNVTDSLLNGGDFGPEGGIIATIVIILGFIVVNRIYKESTNKNDSVAN